jgi:hypothetical protein
MEHVSKSWWAFVARQDVDHLPDRKAALALETRLITKYRPPFNTQQNPGCGALKAEYLRWRSTPTWNASFRDLCDAVDRRLPLYRLSTTNADGNAVFASHPVHFPIAQRLSLGDGEVRLHGKRKYGRAISLDLIGPTAHVTFTGRPLIEKFEIATAFAKIRFLGNNEFQSARISGVTADDGSFYVATKKEG